MEIIDITYAVISVGWSYIFPLDYFYLLRNDDAEKITFSISTTDCGCIMGLLFFRSGSFIVKLFSSTIK